MPLKKVATLDQIPEKQGIAVEVDGTKIALFKVDGEVRAVEAACARHDAPLERGIVEGDELFCPWHEATFDLETGVCSKFPGQEAAKIIPVQVHGNDILIDT